MKQTSCIGCPGRITCIMLADMASIMTQAAFADATFIKSDIKGAGVVVIHIAGRVDALALKEMLESSPVFRGATFENSAYAKIRAQEKANPIVALRAVVALGTNVASTVMAKAKKLGGDLGSYLDITGMAERAAKKAINYVARPGANGHYTGAGVAAIGA